MRMCNELASGWQVTCDYLLSLPIQSEVVWTPDPTHTRKDLGNNLARKYPARMPQFLNSANFLFQIFSAIGQVLLQFSKFPCSTVYLLPVH